jgi:ectoine hydroxylase-related dioxygenase (phytanoyl-CoA dioxygenase family)
VATVQTGLIDELDARGFAVIRSFATAEQVMRLVAVVDEVISAVLAEKQQEALDRQAAGERRINVWHPGEPGVIFKVVSDRPEVRWLINDERLLEITERAKGSPGDLHQIGALASMPGFGHQGLHPDHEGAVSAFGAWDALVFVVLLSQHRPDTGTIRVLPGSHRLHPQFTEWGSAMPPHPDEVRIEGEAGDVFVYSGHLWKSATFNGGHEPVKSLLVAGVHDVGWGR